MPNTLPVDPEIRVAARLVLLDEHGRVLLLHHIIGPNSPFWATPGGGVEPGEALDAAARREATEELGSTVDVEFLWSGETRFTLHGRDTIQRENFFRAHPHGPILGPAVQVVHELEGITDARWWSADEITAATERVYPLDLAERIRGLTVGGER